MIPIDGDLYIVFAPNEIQFKKFTISGTYPSLKYEDHGRVPIPEGLTVDGAERVGDDHFITEISKDYDIRWEGLYFSLRAPTLMHNVSQHYPKNYGLKKGVR